MKPDAADTITEHAEVPAKVCHHYVVGKCERGSKCSLQHPPNLDPEMKPKSDYMVSHQTGQACKRCLDRHFICDKPGRAAADPCSGCRHFGGEDATCVLQPNLSHNDNMWSEMMNSGPEYSLPTFKRQDAPVRNRSKSKDAPKDENGNRIVLPPQPMKGVGSKWNGLTRDQLLGQPDMLPLDVRQHPRAYLSPRILDHRRERREKRLPKHGSKEEPASGTKRSHASLSADLSSDVQPAARQYGVMGSPPYQVPQIPRPPRDPQRGEAHSVLCTFGSNGFVTSATARYASLPGEGVFETVYHALPAFGAPPAFGALPALGAQGYNNVNSMSFTGSRVAAPGPLPKKSRRQAPSNRAHESTAQQSTAQRQSAPSMRMDTSGSDALAPQRDPTPMDEDSVSAVPERKDESEEDNDDDLV